MDTLETLKQLELELHQPMVRSDSVRLGQLLHDSFFEIGRSGRLYTRADMLDALQQEKPDFTVWAQDFALQAISDDIAVLTYKSAHRNRGGKFSHHALRSSLWQKTLTGWQIRFHQGTPTEAFV